jgi:hypothetical protein
MKTKIIFCCLFCLLSCKLSTAGDYDFFGPWAGYGCDGYYRTTTYSQESIPYFALHPPVYYSKPIPRIYGESPFPYPPGMTAYQAYTPPQPQIIKNEPIDEANPPTDQQYQTRQPLRITNPFVQQSDNTTMLKGVKWGTKKTPKPMVVYPASLAWQTK